MNKIENFRTYLKMKEDEADEKRIHKEHYR